jgi:hypothetical protein
VEKFSIQATNGSKLNFLCESAVKQGITSSSRATTQRAITAEHKYQDLFLLTVSREASFTSSSTIVAPFLELPQELWGCSSGIGLDPREPLGSFIIKVFIYQQHSKQQLLWQ